MTDERPDLVTHLVTWPFRAADVQFAGEPVES